MRINGLNIAAFFLVLVNLLYAASHVLAKGVMPIYLSPTAFITLRVFGATALFWLSSFFSKISGIDKKDIIRFILCGFFGVALNQLLFFHGLNLTSPINAGIIMAFNPIMVAFLSVFLINEKLNLKQWLGIAIGAIGAISLSALNNTGSFSTSKGDLFLLGNSLSYAIYLILAKPLMQKYQPLTVITWVFTIGSIMMLLFPYSTLEIMGTHWDFPKNIWVKVVFVIVGVTYLTYLFTVIGLRYVSSTVVSVFIYFQPIFVIVFSYLFAYIGWSEDYTNDISFRKIILMSMVFLGVFLTSNNQKTKNKI